MAYKEHGGFNKVLLKNIKGVNERPWKVRKFNNKTMIKHALSCKLFKELKRVAKEPKRA